MIPDTEYMQISTLCSSKVNNKGLFQMHGGNFRDKRTAIRNIRVSQTRNRRALLII